VLLFGDTDVVFRNPETLLDLGASIVAHDAAFAGELRGTGKLPFVHASFLVVRRDWYYRRSGVPWLYHPTPAVPMQPPTTRDGREARL
jgi:hypothetical protein